MNRVPFEIPEPAGHHGRRPCASRGFTLLELLVTMTILSGMAAMIFGAFRMTSRFWTRGDQVIESSQRFRIMAQLFRKQISCAYSLDVRNQAFPPGMMNPNDPMVQQAMQQGMQAGSPMLATPVFLGGPTELRFVSMYPLRPMESAGMNVVRYRLRPMAEENGYELLETESLYLDRSMLLRMSPPLSSDQGGIVVFDHIQEMKFEYLDVDPLTGKTFWQQEWDSEILLGLPRAVALDLVLNEDVGRMGVKHRLVVPVIAEPFKGRSGMGGRGLFQQLNPQLQSPPQP